MRISCRSPACQHTDDYNGMSSSDTASMSGWPAERSTDLPGCRGPWLEGLCRDVLVQILSQRRQRIQARQQRTRRV